MPVVLSFLLLLGFSYGGKGPFSVTDTTVDAEEVSYFGDCDQADLPPILHSYNGLVDGLHFLGPINLSRPDVGTLRTDDQLWVLRAPIDGSLKPVVVYALGKLAINADERLVECDGHLLVDCIRQQIVLKSQNGTVEYTDAWGRVEADQLTIDYCQSQQGIQLGEVRFTGEVSMIHQKSQWGDVIHLQRAMADKLVYTPDSETITLHADPGNRVQFYDESDQIRMSADGLILNRQDGTAQGVGRVRITLLEEELRGLP